MISLAIWIVVLMKSAALSWWAVLKRINSIFSSFSFNRLTCIHVWILSNPFCRISRQHVLSAAIDRYLYIYNVKRIRPSTEPWGTPDVRVVLGDWTCGWPWPGLSTTTLWALPVRYCSIHDSSVPSIPNLYLSLFNNRVWITMANAELRSKRTKHITDLSSTASRMSVLTFSKAVSVEWLLLYADCNFSKLPDLSVILVNWFQTLLSMTLDKYERLETGW